ncbi:hypothetical protein ACLB1E_36405 [Escherichia coli]
MAAQKVLTAGGITVDELQRIKFDQLDFTNFDQDLMNNQKIPDNGALTEKVKEQIAGQLKQVGQKGRENNESHIHVESSC